MIIKNCLNCRFQPEWGQWDHWSEMNSRTGVCHIKKLNCTHYKNGSTQPKTCAEWSNPLLSQIGGSHYSRLGDYQPWIVLRKWLTTEEFTGAIKKDVLSYICRERHKNNIEDLKKALHTLEIGITLLEDMNALD